METDKHKHESFSSDADRIAALEAEIRALKAKSRETESQFQFLLDHLPILFSVFDPEGTFTQLQGKGLQRLGMNAEEVIGQSVFDIYSKYAHVVQAILPTLEGKAVSGEWEFEENQYYRYAYQPEHHENGELTRILGVALDITDLMRMQRESARAGKDLAFFFKYAPAAIATFDRDMNYLQVSDRWLEDYRLGAVDLIGKNHYEVFPEVPDRWKAVHQRCLKGAIESCREDSFPRQDGSVDYVNWVATPWYDEHEEIGGLIFFTEVINEQIEAKYKQIRLHRQLKESNERLEHFTRVVAGKVLAPLDQLISWSGGLWENEALRTPESLQKSANRMQQEARHVRSLVAGFLEFNEMGKAENYQQLDLEAIISQAKRLIDPELQARKAEIHLDQLPGITGNEKQMTSLFKHLLDNAIRYNESEVPAVYISAERRGDEWLFCVRDNGIGIEPEQEKAIFTLLNHVDPEDKYAGVGVGLTICLRIVQSAGGKIWMESSPGEGSSCFFSWPIQMDG